MSGDKRRTQDTILNALSILAAACAVTLTGLALRDRFAAPSAPLASRDTTTVPVDGWEKLISSGHRLGSPSGALTILEFGDFECPACGAFEVTLRKFRAAHPSDVAIVFRHWPLPYHHLAYPAARASECASAQGRFAEFHDLLYARQDSLGILPLHDMAERAGVSDLAAFDRCNASAQQVPAIEMDIAAALNAGGHGTPTVVINGMRLPGLPDAARLEQLLVAARSPRNASASRLGAH